MKTSLQPIIDSSTALEQAELWNKIAGVFKDRHHMSRLISGQQYLTQQVIFPRFEVRGQMFFCNDLSLNLEQRPLTLVLFKEFYKSETLSRIDLIRIIYGEQVDYREPSKRFNIAMSHNITKLISRARTLADRQFNDPRQKWIEWFVYDQSQSAWHFYRLTNHYLKNRLQLIRNH